MKEYAASRKAFLGLRPLCEVWRQLSQSLSDDAIALCKEVFGANWATPAYSCDVHHVKGRTGTNYLDMHTWMAVSRKGHMWIHNHPKKSREMGWLS
jgi:hypothetical protein